MTFTRTQITTRAKQRAKIRAECSWYVGYRKEKPTKDQIYNIIDWLRKVNEGVDESEAEATMITTTKATQGMLINIVKYDFYQNPKNYESNEECNNEQETKATREQRQPDNINKNDKNDKKKIFNVDSVEYRLAEKLKSYILRNNPQGRFPTMWICLRQGYI
ncbi:MAG: hypothetical protein H0Z28_11640 [Archaeoglobus sp.]|nr:hypothetical protein [Archaeoglobus sp.]